MQRSRARAHTLEQAAAGWVPAPHGVCADLSLPLGGEPAAPIVRAASPQVRSGRSTAPIGPPTADELSVALSAAVLVPAALAERLARESWYVRCSGCSE